MENTLLLVGTEHHRFHTSNEFLIIVGWAIGPTRTSVRACAYRSTLRQYVLTRYVPRELSVLLFLRRRTRRTDGDKTISLLRSNDRGNGTKR